MSNKVSPVFISSSGTGDLIDFFRSIEAKFRELFEREFPNLDLHLNDNTTTYTATGLMDFSGGTVSILVDGRSYEIGDPGNLQELIDNLNDLRISFFTLEDGNIQSLGFHDVGNITQNGNVVFLRGQVVQGTNVPNLTNVIEEVALKLKLDPTDILRDFDDIGYTANVNTYQYDTDGVFDYTGEFWLLLDRHYIFIGTPSSIQELANQLNAMKIGEVTLNDPFITLKGNHIYGLMRESQTSVQETVTLPDIQIDTTGAISSPNLFSSSSYDMSRLDSIASNTEFIDAVQDLGLGSLGFPQGAQVNFIHYVDPAGDGYNFDTVEVAHLIDPACSIHQNSGCTTYGREFFDEYNQVMDATGIDKGTISLNVTAPLFPYADNQPIDWANVDIGNVIDEIDILIARASDFNYDITRVELGMELTLTSWQPLFQNGGGSTSVTSVTSSSGAVFHIASIGEYKNGDFVNTSSFTNYTNGKFWIGSISGSTFKLYTTRAHALAGTSPVAFTSNDTGSILIKGEGVYCKILTHTNAGAPVSILDYLKANISGVKLVADSELWENNTGLYPDWNNTVSQLEDIDDMRQYTQFYESNMGAYYDEDPSVPVTRSIRYKVAQIRTTFLDFITDTDFNSKTTWISQVECKANAKMKNTVGNGLGLAELYFGLTLDSLDNSNLISGIQHFNLKQIITRGSTPTTVVIKLPYYYLQMIGMVLKDGNEKIDITFTDPMNSNVIALAVQNGTDGVIGILNPTSTSFTQTGLSIDGQEIGEFDFYQRYAPGADPASLTDSIIDTTITIDPEDPDSGDMTFNPYSLTVISFTLP